MVFIPPKITVPILAHEVEPYHIITAAEIGKKVINVSDIKPNNIKDIKELVGHYSLIALRANKPIDNDQVAAVPKIDIFTETLESPNTVIVSLSVSNSPALGSVLQPADIVSIAAIPSSTSKNKPLEILDGVLVLDVKTMTNGTVALIALSHTQWLKYLEMTRDATLVIARPAN
jgi:hypothetical protein